MTIPRLYLDQYLAAGARAALDADQSRYLTGVLRLGAGASVRVFNGRDGEWRARIVEAGKRGAALEAAELIRPQDGVPDLILAFSPLKRQATDWLVEKATELGVGALQPVLMRRSVAETVRLDRLHAIAREAAEQTERLGLPAIRPAMSLAKLADQWEPSRPLIYADEAGDAPDEPMKGQAWGGREGRAAPLLDVLERQKGEGLGLLIGPEGGFDPQERAMLRDLGFVRPVSLGPRILRAETAAVAALAVIQAAWGDWSK